MQGQESFGRRVARAITRLAFTLLVLGLVGAVGFLLAQLNARTFLVERRGDLLVVLKGRQLPWGHVPYAPADGRAADAYAPMPAPAEEPGGLVGKRFSDREELDRALFEFFAAQARPRILSASPEQQEQGLFYLRRAEQLTGLTEEQSRTLRKLQADAAFFQGRARLDDARKRVAEALTQLRLAAESTHPNARAAHQMLSEVGPAARALEEALRRAVHTLSGPPGTEGAPPSTSASQTQAPGAPDASAPSQGSSALTPMAPESGGAP